MEAKKLHGLSECVEYKDGFILEVKSLDQYSSEFDSVKKKYGTANSICGYVALAASYFIANKISTIKKEVVSKQLLEELLPELCSIDKMRPHIVKIMSYMHSKRTTYIRKHPDEFKTEKERKGYCSDWLANFEVSDYIKENYSERLMILRHLSKSNNAPLDLYKHEEKKRLVEEDKYLPHKYILEQPTKNTDGTTGILRYTPDEWVGKRSKETPCIVADVIGHFLVIQPVIDEHGTNMLVIINSSKESNYTNYPIMGHFYDLHFGGCYEQKKLDDSVKEFFKDFTVTDK